MQNGDVSGIGKWMPEPIYEIDLHLPDVDMEKWNTILLLKIKVGRPSRYRDYTAGTGWNVKRTCTMLIEIGCEWHGSSWGKNPRVGDRLYASPAHVAGLPFRPRKITRWAMAA